MSLNSINFLLFFLIIIININNNNNNNNEGKQTKIKNNQFNTIKTSTLAFCLLLYAFLQR